MNSVTNLLPVRSSENASGTRPDAASTTVERPALSWRIDPASARPVASWTIAPPAADAWLS